MFDAFYITKADGLALGLSISRSIFDAHAGSYGRPRVFSKVPSSSSPYQMRKRSACCSGRAAWMAPPSGKRVTKGLLRNKCFVYRTGGAPVVMAGEGRPRLSSR